MSLRAIAWASLAAVAACGPGGAHGAGATLAASASPWTAHAARPAAAASPVTITAVGDMMLGSTPDLPPDPGGYFDEVKSTLDAGSQIVFGNLEGTLTTATTSKCRASGSGASGCFAFHDPPDYAQYYKQAGFTVLNDANNHSYDYGAAGQAQTVQAIHAAGLAQTGLPGEITTVTAHGVTVAFVAFAPYDYDANLLDLPAAKALISKAAAEAQLVVVYMHAGAEGSDADHVTGQEETFAGEDRGNAEEFAHMAVDAGADLVIASGPHVLRGMQFYKGHLIAYSLGNFAGYHNFNASGDLSMSAILRVTLTAAGAFGSARIYPVELSGEGRPSPGGGAVSFIAGLSKDDFGSTAAVISAGGQVTPP